MKKITALLVLVLILVGCGTSKVTSSEYEYKFNDSKGIEQKVFINVDLEEGKITKIAIDETYLDSEGNLTTKKELGDAYNMKSHVGAKGEWYEQIAHLEKELIGTDGKIALDESGYPTDADVTTGCTINLTNIQKAVLEAISNAK